MQEFFSGWPVAKTLPSNAESDGLITGQEAKIPQASGPKNQKCKQQKQCCKNSIKTFLKE